MLVEKAFYQSPFSGLLSLCAIVDPEQALAWLFSCHFDDNSCASAEMKTPPNAIFTPLLAQLEAYFAGELKQFDLSSTLPPMFKRGTPFQQAVWTELQQIPYGQTISYTQLAKILGKPPKSARAVANAVKQNPFLIIVPCHRVIAQNGTLSGYSGGVDKKAWLLAHEQKYTSLST